MNFYPMKLPKGKDAFSKIIPIGAQMHTIIEIATALSKNLKSSFPPALSEQYRL